MSKSPKLEMGFCQNQNLENLSRDCDNVLTDLLIEIRHNGTGGVSGAEAFVETAKIDRVTSPSFTQKFSYAHFWVDENVTSADVELRSGNPG